MSEVTARNLRKTRVGKVVSNKMDKTIVVAIADKVKHPLFGKVMNRTIKIHAQMKTRSRSCGKPTFAPSI